METLPCLDIGWGVEGVPSRIPRPAVFERTETDCMVLGMTQNKVDNWPPKLHVRL